MDFELTTEQEMIRGAVQNLPKMKLPPLLRSLMKGKSFLLSS